MMHKSYVQRVNPQGQTQMVFIHFLLVKVSRGQIQKQIHANNPKMCTKKKKISKKKFNPKKMSNFDSLTPSYFLHPDLEID